jgi:hypothetical protein
VRSCVEIKPRKSRVIVSTVVGSNAKAMTKSKMTAPNPQEITSKKDMLKISISRFGFRIMASPEMV